MKILKFIIGTAVVCTLISAAICGFAAILASVAETILAPKIEISKQIDKPVIKLEPLVLASMEVQTIRPQPKPERIILNSNNTINFKDAITDESVQKAMSKFATLRNNKPLELLYLVFTSPGGSIDAGITFQRFLDSQSNYKIIVINAASMASMITEASDVERLIVEDGYIMFHRARGGIEGQFDGELESRLAMFKKVLLGIEKRVASRMNLELPDYHSKIVNEWWLYGQEAIDAKAADRIVSVKCSDELAAKQSKQIVKSFFGDQEITSYDCPLF